MDDMLTLTHATERDVDLLIVEELKCSHDFVRWFVEQASDFTTSPIGYSTSMVLHSRRRTYNRREIDILLSIRSDRGQRVSILIENKLDTSEQFQQAESYRHEAETLVTSGEADLALTILVCPKAYAETNSNFAKKFDGIVSYEAIASFLEKRNASTEGELAKRLSHRHDLFKQAIQKLRRGYEGVPLPVIEKFNAKYVALLQQLSFDLKPGPSMLKEGRPGESKTMIFHPDALPNWEFLPQTRLVHQLREGNANVNFYTWGDYFTRLAGIMGSDLAGTPYRLVPSINKRVGGRSGLMVVVSTPSINNLEGFEEQKDKIVEGMQSTAELRSWFWANKKAIKRRAEAARG